MAHVEVHGQRLRVCRPMRDTLVGQDRHASGHRDGPGLLATFLGQANRQHAILETGFSLLDIDIARQGNGALKYPIGALHDVVGAVVCFAFETFFTALVEGISFDGDLAITLVQTG